MLEIVRDLLTIYSWKEFWLVLSVPLAMMCVWTLFSLLVLIENDIVRGVGTWSLIFSLILGAATVDALRKQQSKV